MKDSKWKVLVVDDEPNNLQLLRQILQDQTTKRPYKEPFSLEKSYAIIKESSGSHFDPNVVGAFFATEDEIATPENQEIDI